MNLNIEIMEMIGCLNSSTAAGCLISTIVTFEYLVNMQYIENLEGVLFIRGVEYGIWGFLFVGGFLLLLLLFCILLHIEGGTLN